MGGIKEGSHPPYQLRHKVAYGQGKNRGLAMTFAKASEEKTDSERKKEKKGEHNEKS
jgi:hypothetical protein